MSSLASLPLLLITEDKGGPTHGHKTKIQFCSAEAGISVLPSLVKMQVVEEIYRAQTEIPIILLYMKFGFHNIFNKDFFYLFRQKEKFIYWQDIFCPSLLCSFFLISSSDGFICCSIIIPNQAQ